MNGFTKTTEFYVLSVEDQFSECTELISRMQQKNVFVFPSYLKFASLAESCSILLMVLKDGDHIALLPYAKRRINDLPFIKKQSGDYWDLITPFEFASINTNVRDDSERRHMTGKLLDAIASYCRDTNIVCEFIRFDPFMTDIPMIEGHYKLGEKKNICIDISRSIHDIQKSYHRSAQKNIKRAISSHLRFEEVRKTSQNIAYFIELYWQTLRRVNAKRYYYFSEPYFQAMLGHCENAALFFVMTEDGHPIAASIVLHTEGIAYHHLTGSDATALHLRPNDFMIHSLIHWAADKALNTLHLGGGTKPIRDFKSKFSGTSISYYYGSRIHQKRRYDYLCDRWMQWKTHTPDWNFFPMYRNGCN